jgi:enoyl-CoA hydratase
MQGSIEFKQQAGIASVRISHPARLNAMSRDMWRELRAVFESIHISTDLRCVLLSGDNGNFCSGGDISEYADFRFQESSLRDFHEDDVWGALSALLACDVPIVAQIDGNCMGAGLEIASCCDIRLAGVSARFGAPIARLGFAMAPREAALVAREVGLLKARHMLLEAAVFSAAEMQACNFISRVLADDQTAIEALATAQRLLALGPQAARRNKQTLRAISTLEASASEAASAYADSPEHREGISAFLEKRSPDF